MSSDSGFSVSNFGPFTIKVLKSEIALSRILHFGSALMTPKIGQKAGLCLLVSW